MTNICVCLIPFYWFVLKFNFIGLPSFFPLSFNGNFCAHARFLIWKELGVNFGEIHMKARKENISLNAFMCWVDEED